jgi:hypothetical protein
MMPKSLAEPGTEVRLKLRPAGATTPLWITARLRHRRSLRHGFEFVRLSERDVEALGRVFPPLLTKNRT